MPDPSPIMKKSIKLSLQFDKKEYLLREDILKIAESYFEEGIVCVPLCIETDGEQVKLAPAFKWKQIKSYEDFMQAWKRIPISRQITVTGLAALTGSVSRITVIDIDNLIKFSEKSGMTVEELKNITLCQESKSGGLHLFFQYEPELENFQDRQTGFDVKNNGGLINLCPTRVYYTDLTGKTKMKSYRWLNSKRPAKMPEKIKKMIPVRKQEQESTVFIHTEEKEKRTFRLKEKTASKIGELYRQGLLEGFIHIDCALMTALIEAGYEDTEIHRLWEIIYREEYDEKLTQYMIKRNRTLERKIGTGTLFKRLKELNLLELIEEMTGEGR